MGFLTVVRSLGERTPHPIDETTLTAGRVERNGASRAGALTPQSMDHGRGQQLPPISTHGLQFFDRPPVIHEGALQL